MNRFIILSAFLAVSIFSCKKREKCDGGTDGEAIIKAFVKHHVLTIPNQVGYLDTIYLKFNTKESPGSNLSDYDTYFTGQVGEDFVICNGLKCGDYYLLAAGYDSSINARVFGGIPFTIPSESKETFIIDMPVVE